jgi:hypothetical protein
MIHAGRSWVRPYGPPWPVTRRALSFFIRWKNGCYRVRIGARGTILG